ncbi:hypothetical protein BJ322DRAFT_1114126 [Thelephora terrestris]|uniref:HECT-type E3 ubiquitin transferase n=1 Tax=Thelephora terrestris TaxID=56493 RepID=A0A9P6H590_9AGAM|nr:hypothetical protein BJ322DRAFT_1114126 [Thelephora terrestris]
MDLSQHNPESSSPSSEQVPLEPSSSTSTSRNLRSSARVRAAKEKEKEKERDPESEDRSAVAADVAGSSRSTPQSNQSKRPRAISTSKGKGKETEEQPARPSKKARRVTFPPQSSGLSIQEPPRDFKGKKRAVPEATSDEDTSVALKRPRTVTSSYSLRSRSDLPLTEPLEMPKKTRNVSSKGKIAAAKGKATAPGPSRSDFDAAQTKDAPVNDEHEDANEGEPDSPDRHDRDDDDEEEDGPKDRTTTSNDSGLGHLDESTAMAIFGDYRQLSSYMLGLSGRLKSLLNNIKPSADPTTRLISLQELTELLSISTEDTLAGSFPVESYIRELVKILGGTGNTDDDDDRDEDSRDPDPDLAAALALIGGSRYQGDENPEAQVLACRCLANLMEALPGVAHTVVYHGAIPVLCSKLIEISYIDLAEQTLSTLEKISEEFPSAIVREGGLNALLSYLDFFSIAVQRTAIQAASNCCRNISPDHFSMVQGVWPIIRNCLGYSDQRLVEFACLCVIRVIDSYYRASVKNLEALVDRELITAVNLLLLPSGGSPLIASATFTSLLRSLAISARASSKITMTLLEADIVDTVFQILTGVLPSAQEEQGQGDSASGQGLGGGLADMTVMQNLAHRPKDQVEEALSLICELMPPLPKDGVFDHKGYTEKALNKLVKTKAKADRAASRREARETSSAVSSTYQSTSPNATTDSTEATATTETISETPSREEQAEVSQNPAKDQVIDRNELLRSKPEVVGRFMQLMVPVLIDVYAASVITSVRLKTLTGLLKAVGFLETEDLKRVFSFVPVASFSSSILSSKDHPTLVLGALQLVEILLSKVPTEYAPAFRREGVFHEVEALASRSFVTKPKEDVKNDESTPEPMITPPPAVAAFATSTPGYKKLTSLALEPEDAITLRARVIRLRHLSSDEKAEHGVYSVLHKLVQQLSDKAGSEKSLSDALKELASLFSSPRSSLSSFELLQSGLVDSLLAFATDEDRSVGVQRRQGIFLEAFSRKAKPMHIQTPFSVFVKKLQESLTRMEPYEVVTIAQGVDDSRRSSPSLLARQLRLRLIATEDSDVPKALNNIVVSIHAIATFQALHDYLRPRISGLLNSSRLLAALTGSLSSASSSRPPPPLESSTKPPEATTTESGPARRRSLRLSAKKDAQNNAESAKAPDDVTPAVEPETSKVDALSDTGMSHDDTHIEADFTDDEVDADVFDEDLDGDRSVVEKTVNLSVADDGTKVEAQTPDGTRVATPNPLKELSSGTQPGSSQSKVSYAAALKNKVTDWHLEFSMDDHVLPLGLTIYGAIHQHEARKNSGAAISSSAIWQGVYPVKFKRSWPPLLTIARSDGVEFGSRSRTPAPSSSSTNDASHSKILRLLRVLHQINACQRDKPGVERNAIPESSFINNKLTAKLTRQLEEPMIVASSCLPDWSLDLPQHFPFLFPFSTRYNFLQSTSFGYARLILKWQSQQARGQDNSRRDDGVGFLGRLQRQKVRISRKHIFESAVKVFELYGSSSSVLEVEYFEEVGTGLGPTLEFYSLVSKEFARRDLKLWRDGDQSLPGVHVHHPLGLFPAPMSTDDSGNDKGLKRTHIFRVIGQFMAKSMLDSRIIDLSFNKIFLKLVLGEHVALTIDNLKLIDPDLASSLEKLQELSKKTCGGKLPSKVDLIETVSVEDLALDFTVPGYEIELKPNGRDLMVTSDNVDEYIAFVIDAVIGKGIQAQAKALREGFSKVFPIKDLATFTVDELVMLFGNSDEDWSEETLGEALKADHGFTADSKAIQHLIEIMAEYDSATRRSYLQFITGSPKLPIGGFRGLNPPLTVVRKPHESPLTADDYLPSVMTCVNYLKLPDYSCKEVMKQKIRTAMMEGTGSFHLS